MDTYQVTSDQQRESLSRILACDNSNYEGDNDDKSNKGTSNETVKQLEKSTSNGTT